MSLSSARCACRVRVQVHDELLFEVPDSEVAATLPLVQRVMETAAAPTHTLSVPLIVDAGSGPSWGDAH